MLTLEKKLTLLNEKVQSCTLCPSLVKNRTNTVFADGNPNSKVVFCGEAPGKQESEIGIPFVGRAGQLLTNIIKACGWERQKDVYIMNVIKCRPPNNRTPHEEECANCRPFFDLQLKVVNPDYIICLGAVAAQNLLKVDIGISRLRGRWHTINKPITAKVICTWHPAFVLRRGDVAKREIWQDLQPLLEEMKTRN